MDDYKELIGRLLDAHGGPDGQEAADAIATLTEQLAEKDNEIEVLRYHLKIVDGNLATQRERANKLASRLEDLEKCQPKENRETLNEACDNLLTENARLLDKLKSAQESHAFWMREEMGVQKQLRAELEKVKEMNAGLALALLYDSNPNEDCIGEDEWAAIKAELRRVKRERNAAVRSLHGKCSACKHYRPQHNQGVCRFCRYETARDRDAESNDHWQWRGPQKEE